MPNLSDYFLPVSQPDIAERGLLIDYMTQINDADSTGTWEPKNDFAETLRHADGLSVDSAGFWKRNTPGFAYSDTAFTSLVRCLTGFPAPALNIRRYYLEWAQFSSSVAGTNDGLNFIINYQDSTNFNFFQVIWTGSQYSARYTERVAGVDTNRITLNMSTIIDEPVYGYLMLEEWVDSVFLTVAGFETDAGTSDYGSYRGVYNGAPRANKAATGFYVGMGNISTPNRFGVRSIRINEIG